MSLHSAVLTSVHKSHATAAVLGPLLSPPLIFEWRSSHCLSPLFGSLLDFHGFFSGGVSPTSLCVRSECGAGGRQQIDRKGKKKLTNFFKRNITSIPFKRIYKHLRFYCLVVKKRRELILSRTAIPASICPHDKKRHAPHFCCSSASRGCDDE